MWHSRLNFSDNKQLCKVVIEVQDTPMSFAQVIQGWIQDADFRSFYISLIAHMPYTALFWESPAVSRSTVSRRYEFVAVNSTALVDVKADAHAFSQHFGCVPTGKSIVTFDNLGNDAHLVVPCPIASEHCYAHLAEFIRLGPVEQCHDFFRTLGGVVDERLSDRPVWINTSGVGIYWLHARLDSQPKYYTYPPYICPSIEK